MCARIQRLLLVVLSVVALRPDAGTASQVHFLPIEEVAAEIEVTVLAEVLTARAWDTRMTLPDGREGPTTSAHAEYQVKVQQVLVGKCLRAKETVRVEAMIPIPVQYDEWGREELHWSPITPRGDDDLNLKPGRRYLLSFSSCDRGDAVHGLLRADDPSQRKELSDAVKRVQKRRTPTAK